MTPTAASSSAATSRDKIDAKICYEVNIFDKRPDPTYGTGAIVDVAKVDPMPKAGGKWNTFEITAKGSHLVVVLNGQKTVDVQDSKHAGRPVRPAIRLGRDQVPQGADQAAVDRRRVALPQSRTGAPVFSGCAFLCHAQAVRMIVARSEWAGRKFNVARAAEGSATR